MNALYLIPLCHSMIAVKTKRLILALFLSGLVLPDFAEAKSGSGPVATLYWLVPTITIGVVFGVLISILVGKKQEVRSRQTQATNPENGQAIKKLEERLEKAYEREHGRQARPVTKRKITPKTRKPRSSDRAVAQKPQTAQLKKGKNKVV